MNNESKRCLICKSYGKYKCPNCYLHYCSTPCCKKHRDIGCTPVQKEESIIQKVSSHVTNNHPLRNNVVPLEKLELLRHNKSLHPLLQNPHLRILLQVINESSKPEEIMQKAMQEPLFVEFVDACLGEIDPPLKEDT